jgi:hypothetical protein
MKNISKYTKLTKDEAINAILVEAGLANVLRAPDEHLNQKIRNAMEGIGAKNTPQIKNSTEGV